MHLNMNASRRGFLIAVAICGMALAARAEQVPVDSPQGIAKSLLPFVEQHALAGAVTVVVNKDKVLSIETVGYADIAKRKPMREDSIFWIASMTKAITGAAVMMLVDEGKIDLDAPVEKYLPEFKGQMVIVERNDERMVLKKPARPVTVRNMLSHTSGMAFKSGVEEPTLDMLPLETVVRSYAMSPLLHEPDSKYLYSNEGINTAGRVIEVASGMSYEEFMNARLFYPLGMKDTGFWLTKKQAGRVAKTYKPNAAKSGLEESRTQFLHYPLDEPRRQPMPGGGLFSTGHDVARFCQMILNGGELDGRRYLSGRAITEMTKRQTQATLKESYGLGWAVQGNGEFGHGGALATNMTIHKEKGLATIYLVQHQGYAGPDGGKILPAFRKAALEKFGK